jgi:hypothetical protein
VLTAGPRWPWVFCIHVPIGVVVPAVLVRLLPAMPARAPPSSQLDVPGAVQVAAATGSGSTPSSPLAGPGNDRGYRRLRAAVRRLRSPSTHPHVGDGTTATVHGIRVTGSQPRRDVPRRRGDILTHAAPHQAAIAPSGPWRQRWSDSPRPARISSAKRPYRPNPHQRLPTRIGTAQGRLAGYLAVDSISAPGRAGPVEDVFMHLDDPSAASDRLR